MKHLLHKEKEYNQDTKERAFLTGIGQNSPSVSPGVSTAAMGAN